ncbi:Uncharacterised protein [Serratia marcescens]|uniref:DUF6896 domain-containing protein n=1 Tax=Serratia marcescens TaxID=615 RepID=UPI000745272A|nr:hypothetical protein [Serratia marcescens]ASM32007.1 hypothetical protein BVG84_13705 [Serratia marcescens]CVE65848.1 Uncharacterised protein [Serratia marcescens]
MNEKLVRLVVDFQESVLSALKLMQRSGIRMPSSRNDWIESKIPTMGELDCGVRYYKHGAGCLVSLSTGEVDFDFGEEGEIGGFNLWWLAKFAGENLTHYGFDNTDDINECLNNALDSGELIRPDHGLYYIANVPYIYATDIDSRDPEDTLPSRNKDPVLVLQSHYFQSADLMLENYNKFSRKFHKIGCLSRREETDMSVYLTTWLGLLGVVCEGVRKLNMRILLGNERPESFKKLLPISDNIGRLMKEHADSLRKFRNNVFHLRENTELVRDFFDNKLERIQWARELHMILAEFFSQYRVSCEVHYLINGRRGECDLTRNKRVFFKRKSR